LKKIAFFQRKLHDLDFTLFFNLYMRRPLRLYREHEGAFLHPDMGGGIGKAIKAPPGQRKRFYN